MIGADFARRHRERDLSVRARSRAHERSHVEREHAIAHPTAVVQRRARPLSKTKTTLSSRLISPQGSRKKKPARSSGDKVCGSRPAASGQVRGVRGPRAYFPTLRGEGSTGACNRCKIVREWPPWRTSGEFEILGAITSGHCCAGCIQSGSARPRPNPMER